MKRLPQILCCLMLLTAAPAMAQDASPATFKAYDMNLSGYDYPHPVSYYDFKAQEQDLRMAYMDVKPAGEATATILLLHGKNFPAAYWADTITALTADGYRVIAPDQIGFGKSTKPAQLQYSFHTLAAWTHDLLAHAGVTGPVIVTGHSMGGMLAIRYALMYPTDVTKLALIGPLGLEDWRRVVPYRTVTDLYADELKQTPDKIKAYQQQAYYDGAWKDEYTAAMAPLAGWTQHADYPRVAYNAALTSDMIFTQPVVYELPDLKMPVLLLVGTRDRTAPGANRVTDPAIRDNLGRYDRLGKTAAGAIPNARLVELEDIGHLPQVESFPAYIGALRDFLSPTPR